MKVLIVDEQQAAKRLERLLNELEPEVELAAILESVESTTNWLLENTHPDLIFMEIQLEDGICFEIFEKVAIKKPVIFTTALDEYALRVLNVNKVNYLLKPLDNESLQFSLKKYREVSRYKSKDLDFKSMLNDLLPKNKERFLIKAGLHYKSVQVSEIACFYKKERFNYIFTFEGNSYNIDYSLDKIEQLVCPHTFFRVNKNFIVNNLAINDIVTCSSNNLKIVIENWSIEWAEIIVNREKVADFKLWMDR